MYQSTTLDNGLRIVTQTMPHTYSICICFFIGAGGRYESLTQSGLSHFVEHLLFKGTTRFPTTKEISEAIEGVGGFINGATDREMTIYWSKTAKTHFPLALDLLVDLLRNSKMDPDDIEKERSIIIEEINASIDSPQERASMLIDETLWPNQPLGRDVAGTRETVKNINRETMVAYINSQYNPKNTVVSIAGNISHEEAVTSLRTILGDWNERVPDAWLPAVDNQSEPRLVVEERDTEQAHLCLAVQGYSKFHPDRFTIDLLNVVLGRGMSSRLFMNVREKLGLAYDIHSYTSHFADAGALTIYAGVDPKQTPGAIGAILNELHQFKREIVPGLELTKAKELSKGHLLLRMEDTSNFAMWLGAQELLEQRIYTIDEVLAIIDKITAEDIYRVANDLLVTEKLNMSILGPIQNNDELRNLLTF